MAFLYRLSVVVLSAPLLWAPCALGAAIEAGPAAATVPSVDGPIWVSVDSAREVDEEAVRAAIAKELGVSISDGASGARAKASVVIAADGSMVVSFEDSSARRLMRAIQAPENPSEVPEAAALLLGNLARDQTSALLERLAPAPTEPEPEPVESKPKQAEERKKEEPDVLVEQQAPPLPWAPVNLALLYPVNTLRHSEKHRVAFDLSLFYSHDGAVAGFAAGTGVLRTERGTRGLVVAGIGLLTPESGAGLAVSGLFSMRGGFDGWSTDGLFTQQVGDMTGLQAAGLVVLRRGELRGLEVAGVAGVSKGQVTGLLASGVLNVHDGPMRGAQVGGAVGLHRGELSGLQMAGAASVQRGTMTGLQAAGGFNFTSDDVSGAQFGTVNVAEDIQGTQIGIVNVGKKVSGLQLGIFNWAEEVDGASVGVVTYSEKGRTQLVSWFDSERPVNLGVRFYTGPLYAMPSIGLRRRRGADEYAPGFSLGARIPFGSAYFDADANYSTRAPDFNFDEHDIDLRYRGLVGYRILEQLAVFAGGGMLHHVHTKSNESQSFDPIVSAGVELF